MGISIRGIPNAETKRGDSSSAPRHLQVGGHVGALEAAEGVVVLHADVDLNTIDAKVRHRRALRRLGRSPNRTHVGMVQADIRPLGCRLQCSLRRV